jgi:hypothetical protein
MSDLDYEAGWARYRVHGLLAGGLLLYGASRIDATRPVAGVLLMYGFPVLALAVAAAPFRHSKLWNAVWVIGGLAAATAELSIARALSPQVSLYSLVPTSVTSALSIIALILAAGVQAAGVGRGRPNTFAAWMGMVTALALYLPTHARVGKDALDAFIAALLVALFVGGGVGLALGGIATRIARRHAPGKAS